MEGPHLYVAVTGDSRAVLGTRKASGQWDAKDLSVDQTLKNPQEFARLVDAHPESERDTVAMRGRVLGGLMPTRAFGNCIHLLYFFFILIFLF